ncbi:MAG: ABC transporter permease, partial [Opitutaceae bacterium]
MTPAATAQGGGWRRLRALIRKETRQMTRDPATMLVGILLPMILLLVFGYGLSLDVKHVPVAIVIENPSAEASELAAGFQLSPYFEARVVASMALATRLLRDREVDGIVRVPGDFARRIQLFNTAEVQVIVNGAGANRARTIQTYAHGAIAQWPARQRGGQP